MFLEIIACLLLIRRTASNYISVLVFDVVAAPQGTEPGPSVVLQQGQEWSCGGKTLTVCQDLHEQEPIAINKHSILMFEFIMESNKSFFLF